MRKSLKKIVIWKHIFKTSIRKQKLLNVENVTKFFYLQWRLKKHEQVHVQRPKKPCKYFVANKDCPFEKLGCKFLHQEKSDLEAIGETDKIEGSEENSVTNEKLITLEVE